MAARLRVGSTLLGFRNRHCPRTRIPQLARKMAFSKTLVAAAAAACVLSADAFAPVMPAATRGGLQLRMASQNVLAPSRARARAHAFAPRLLTREKGHADHRACRFCSWGACRPPASARSRATSWR